jgi:hypothetical protein
VADEETEIQVEATVPPERPDWLPSQFDKPEAVVESWVHANRKITEQGQELAEARKQLLEMQEAQMVPAPQPFSQDIEAQLIDAFESGDGRTIAAATAFLAQQAAADHARQQEPARQNTNTGELTAALASQELAARYPDWHDVKQKIGDLVNADPGILPVSADTPLSDVVKHLDRAYRLVKYDSGETAGTQAAADLAELARLTKVQAQTMSGASVAQQAETYWDDVKGAKSGIPSFG